MIFGKNSNSVNGILKRLMSLLNRMLVSKGSEKLNNDYLHNNHDHEAKPTMGFNDKSRWVALCPTFS